MNKKLLITDIFTFLLGIVLLCVVQLMMQFNPTLLTNRTVLILFAVFIIVYGAFIIITSYKNNIENISIANYILPIILAIVFYIFYSIPSLEFADFNGVGNSVSIAFFGIFCSRYAFSHSVYLKNHKKAKSTTHNSITLKTYSKNMPSEADETMNIVGYVILIVCVLALIYNTFDPCIYFAFPFT